MAIPTDERGVIQACPACGQKNRIPYERLGQTGTCGKCGADLPPLNVPIEIAHDADFDRLIQASLLPIVVDFWAPWCAPCRMVAPEMEKVATHASGRLLVAKVNTEALPGLAARFGIRSIPTMAVFAGGREVSRTAGARPAQDIEAFAFQALGVAPRV